MKINYKLGNARIDLKTTWICLVYWPLAYFFFILLVSAVKLYGQSTPAKQEQEYVCLPCGSDCDHEVFHQAGVCPHCGMRLVVKKSVRFQNITPAEQCRIVANRPDVLLLDVRTSQGLKAKQPKSWAI